jgi:NTE family protein
VSLGIAAVETLLSAQDAAYVDDPCTVRRTIFVPALDVSPLDFTISPAAQQALYDRGVQAGEKFLSSWNFPGYLARCGDPAARGT